MKKIIFSSRIIFFLIVLIFICLASASLFLYQNKEYTSLEQKYNSLQIEYTTLQESSQKATPIPITSDTKTHKITNSEDSVAYLKYQVSEELSKLAYLWGARMKNIGKEYSEDLEILKRNNLSDTPYFLTREEEILTRAVGAKHWGDIWRKEDEKVILDKYPQEIKDYFSKSLRIKLFHFLNSNSDTQ